MKPLVKPRCCWPQMGTIGRNIYIISGERSPSDTIEKLNGVSLAWELSPMTLPQKRGQSRAVFMPQDQMPGCKP